MSQKNETTVLVLALLIALGLVGGGLWWLTERLRNPSNPNTGSTPANPLNQPGQSNINSLAQVPGVPSGLFSYGGSTTWAPIRGAVDPVVQTVWPQFQLRYTNPPSGNAGSGAGIRMLLDDQLAFAASSRSLQENEYQQAKQRGFSLQQIPVAIDGIAIAVHSDLKIAGLTVAQLKDIYTGTVTNWSQIGGPPLPIIPYSRRLEESGTIEFFAENVLAGEAFGSNIQYISSTTQGLREVARNPGAIYYASAPEVVDQCSIKPLPIGVKPDRLVPPYQEPLVPSEECPQKRNKLNAVGFQSGTYPITRRLFVIVKQNGQLDQKAGEAYAQLLLTQQGQALIEKTGFVRIR